MEAFVLRAIDRGYGRYVSTGPASSYISGHPESVLTRHSSFNFHEYQEGRAGFGRIRVFGEEIFSGLGCGYNMHPHHNFIICAFVLGGCLTHINTLGKVDEVKAGDYYVFSAGSGGKHAELNIAGEDLRVIYIWFLPGKLLAPPSYRRSHFDAAACRNRLACLVGTPDGALPIDQDVRVSRLASDTPGAHIYRPRSSAYGTYVFVIDGSVGCEDASLGPQDSMGLWDTETITLRTGMAPTDVLLVETAL